MLPLESREATESTIQRNPLAVVFDRERGMVGVWDEVAFGFAAAAQFNEC